MYFTDRGIEELADRRGDDQVTVAWLAERLRDFVDLNPGFETAVDRLATLARSPRRRGRPLKTLRPNRTGVRGPGGGGHAGGGGGHAGGGGGHAGEEAGTPKRHDAPLSRL